MTANPAGDAVLAFNKLTGDADSDGDIDLADLIGLTACLTGPNPQPPGYNAGCGAYDFDIDADVDAADFANFQAAFTGE